MYNSSRLISMTWIASLGPISFAANAATTAAESFSFMPGYAFAIAATTLVGQRLGAGRPDEAVKTGTLATILATALMSSIALVFFFFPQYIMRVFNPPEAEVMSLGIACLRIAAVEQPFIAITYTLAGGDAGMRHFMNQFGPALKLPWTYLTAPPLSEKLIDDVVEGTTEQLGSHSIGALESYRDDCLLAVMEAVNATKLKHGIAIND